MIIKLEQALGLYREEAVQRLFLGMRPVIKGLNVYYGSAHFLVTGGVLVWLFVRQPDRYPRWRWTLACTTLLGLIGFVAFPVMPPRLIETMQQGVGQRAMGSFVDTLHTVGGLWNFEGGAIAKLSNQYAAMPSLHFAWSLWCCLALWPRLKRPLTRALAVAHPSLTLLAIIVTANHYWLDAAGGCIAVLGGWLIGGILGTGAVGRVTAWSDRRRPPAGAVAGAVGLPAVCGSDRRSDRSAHPDEADLPVDDKTLSGPSVSRRCR